jgi:hypothetical protein
VLTHLFILLFVRCLRATECVVVGAEIWPRLLDVQPLPAFESSVQCIVLIQQNIQTVVKNILKVTRTQHIRFCTKNISKVILGYLKVV